MAKIQYPGNSPYATTPQTSWHIGRYEHRSIRPDTGDRPYTLLPRHTNRPDLLSFELYGTPNFWWVFCVRNPQLRADPVWKFVNGLVIIVPTAEHVRRTVGG